jgi:hypothetical protein
MFMASLTPRSISPYVNLRSVSPRLISTDINHVLGARVHGVAAVTIEITHIDRALGPAVRTGVDHDGSRSASIVPDRRLRGTFLVTLAS